jgi:hypothetical protein
MLIRPVLAVFAFLCLGFSARAGELSAQLPSLALDPPPPPASSELYDDRKFAPYAAPGVGLPKPNSTDVAVSRANPRSSSGTAKPGPGGLDYDLGNNLHMHLSIAGGAAAGGAIGH